MELTNEMIYQLAPYARTLGIQADTSSPARVKVGLPHSTELSTIGGGMHGGALMSLCDLSAAICGGLNAPDGRYATTAESTSYFLKPLNGSAAIATARPVKVGQSVICVEVDVRDESGEHCVRTMQMLSVREARTVR